MGSLQYDGTYITELKETYEGMPFFRKYIDRTEYTIYQHLMEHPHPNLVTVYRLTDHYVDMELLTPIRETMYDEETMRTAASAAKDHLQRVGVFYMDWKTDNLGITSQGQYRLFDFDGSGFFYTDWVLEPKRYWSYRQALEHGLTDPKEMDDYAFDLNLCTRQKMKE
jgi:hypothetical protein